MMLEFSYFGQAVYGGSSITALIAVAVAVFSFIVFKSTLRDWSSVARIFLSALFGAEVYLAGLFFASSPLLAAIAELVATTIPAVLTTAIVIDIEKSGLSRLYAGCFAAVAFAGTLSFSLRPAFAAFMTYSVFRGLISLSELKFKFTRMHLHAYDFIFFLRTSSAPLFVLRNLRPLMTKCLWHVLLYMILLSLIWAIEPAAVGRPYAAASFVVALVALVIVRRDIAPAQFIGHFGSPSITMFLETIGEAIQALCRRSVIAIEPAANEVPALSQQSAAKPDRTPPNIIVILNDSTFPPWLYPSIRYDPSLAEFFRSIDGRSRQLRVETFGGATWMTEFSVLTGIPASCYGSFRAHVFHWATGQIRHSLPHSLKRHGFRTAAFYPVPKEFVGAGDFYHSIGFDEFIDRDMMGTDRDREADAFYFAHATDWLTRHFATRDEPTFIFVATMLNHFPHNLRYVAESGAMMPMNGGANAEFEEYLRRLASSARDYADLRDELKNRFPEREFLLVHFGDHQPSFTWPAFGDQSWLETIWSLPTEEVAYRTYFSIDGVNFQPRIETSLPDALEVAYLGTVILNAAGLPLDPVHAARQELMVRHSGRLFFADQDGKIAGQLNRRLVDAGLISLH
jgi:sulfatase-like protein